MTFLKYCIPLFCFEVTVPSQLTWLYLEMHLSLKDKLGPYALNLWCSPRGTHGGQKAQLLYCYGNCTVMGPVR